ncbi:hypothetical protein K7887_22660 (plasmid) [Sutcliffiella horikoshii]|uniref:hypothetical protein n=1 Tax=Sutcliffiella horikoshii TaxID=79883 RepID=UPI001CBA8466|nr:hypothetical protein [Sutcliffiella horikoshii]UAL49771.1 hypothetical protein K7887_22660 [Sutcliffiella horikoshii]
MREEVLRKLPRKDKKRDVRPTISTKLYITIDRISYITRMPIKDVAEELCERGLDKANVIDHLASYFQRAYWHKTTFYNENLNNTKFLGAKAIKGEKKRISVRFSQTFHERIYHLAYALDTSVSSATGFLLLAACKDADIVNEIVERRMEDHLDEVRVKELKEVVKYINKNNPYSEEVSFMHLISYLMDELMKSTEDTFKRAVDKWLEGRKKHQ